MLKFKSMYGGEYKIIFNVAKYASGHKGTALQMLYWDDEMECWLPYTTATVNLEKRYYSGDGDDEVYIDDNNCPFLAEWFEENGLARYTGKLGESGYCQYWQMRLNMEEIKKHMGADDED